jgi:hypothetical protein
MMMMFVCFSLSHTHTGARAHAPACAHTPSRYFFFSTSSTVYTHMDFIVTYVIIL